MQIPQMRDDAILVYGFPSFDDAAQSSNSELIANATIRYGALFALEDGNASMPNVVYGAPDNQNNGQITPEQRDEWWKWAFGAGVVSAVAYMLYQSVTMKSED